MFVSFGRSDWIRTSGIEVPNFARYQLRHAPKLLNCGRQMWTNCGRLTIFYNFSDFEKCYKPHSIKGFESFTNSKKSDWLRAPKAGALPAGLHPEICIFLKLPGYYTTAPAVLSIPIKTNLSVYNIYRISVQKRFQIVLKNADKAFSCFISRPRNMRRDKAVFCVQKRIVGLRRFG